MRINKNVVLVIIVIVFFVVVTYFIDTDESNVPPSETNSETNPVKEIEKLKQKNAYLNQDIETIKKSLFEAEKFIFDSELASDYLNDYRSFPQSKILYKQIEDTKYIILFKDKVETHLVVALDEPRFDIFLNIPSLSPANGITVDYMEGSEYSYFGGIITDKEIKKVQVSQQ
ncbi:hypothetical protein, partial [Lentibacillus salinarum]